MKITTLSPKQKEILRWCHGKDKDKYDAIICDGAVRSGKTVCMILSFIHWAMRYFDGQTFAICGKTVQSAERNIITPLLGMTDLTAYFELNYKRSSKLLVVTGNDKTNYFYVFGGRDESSAGLIQGLTLAGVLLDEVALMPRSFVEQSLARCSVTGSKYWFNCNPDSPAHWFYEEWVTKPEEKHVYHIHFLLTDNPSLTDEIRERYFRLYPSGVFYQRFILGLWVAADGLVYDVDVNSLIDDTVPEQGRYFISIDYGTLNPFSAGLWCLNGKTATRIKEFYYDGRKRQRQMTDEEYYKAVEELAGDYDIERIIVDPSAASFITCIRKHGRFSVRKAKNDVIDGIRVTSEMVKGGVIKINSSCQGILKEFGMYRWDDKSTVDKVVKEYDHAMDDMRYFCYTVLRRELRWMGYRGDKNEENQDVDM